MGVYDALINELAAGNEVAISDSGLSGESFNIASFRTVLYRELQKMDAEMAVLTGEAPPKRVLKSFTSIDDGRLHLMLTPKGGSSRKLIFEIIENSGEESPKEF